MNRQKPSAIGHQLILADTIEILTEPANRQAPSMAILTGGIPDHWFSDRIHAALGNRAALTESRTSPKLCPRKSYLR